ncbi:MAG TPA: outer membrane beta-barrel protein [Candidatus Polarisedimenticolia bacterium]|nr:outer membrane beta-barrel protein [Candidatus Polarisedimenticolia bacterium]
MSACLALIVALGLAAPATVQAASTGHANFFLGFKMLDEDDWEPLESQPAFGAEVSWGGDDWPILIATDLLLSADDDDEFGADVEARTAELDLGVRKIWEVDNVRPYVGGGIGLISAEVEVETPLGDVDDDDNAIGLWAGGGVFWRLGERFNLGVSGRWSKAEVEFAGADVEAGGLSLGLLLGWGWGD